MKITKLMGAGLLAATVAIAAAVPAQADINDAAFLAVLANEGISSTNGVDHTMISTAYGVCADLDRGYSFAQEVWALQRVSSATGGYLDSGNAGFFVGAAIGAYCPWNSSLIYGPNYGSQDV